MLRVLIINFLVLIPLILAEQPENCHNVRGIVFDPQRAAGVWYLQSRDAKYDDKALECGRVIWTCPDGLNSTLYFENISTITKKPTSIVVEVGANSNTYRHHVPILGEVDTTNFILGADYNRWGVWYQCYFQGGARVEKAWVLTRQQFPDLRKLDRFVDQSFRNWGIPKLEFTRVPQNCQY